MRNIFALNNKAAYVNTIDAHVDSVESLFFWMSEKVVGNVIRDLLIDCEDDESAESAPIVFSKDDDSAEGSVEAPGASEIRKVTIKTSMAFSLTIDYTGADLSFRKALTVLTATDQRTGGELAARSQRETSISI